MGWRMNEGTELYLKCFHFSQGNIFMRFLSDWKVMKLCEGKERRKKQERKRKKNKNEKIKEKYRGRKGQRKRRKKANKKEQNLVDSEEFKKYLLGTY